MNDSPLHYLDFFCRHGRERALQNYSADEDPSRSAQLASNLPSFTCLREKKRLEKIRNRKSETKRTTIRLVDFVLYISCLSVFFKHISFYIYVQTIFFRDEGLKENKCSEFFERNQRLMGRSATLVRLKRKIDRPECPDRNENVCGEHRIWGTAPPQALIRRYLTS